MTKALAVAITIAKYAEKFEISEKTVRRGIASGDIPHVRIGRSIRIPISAVDKLLAEAS